VNFFAKRLEERGRVAGTQAIVTQLGECQTEDLEAAGSSPAYRTFIVHLEYLHSRFKQSFQSRQVLSHHRLQSLLLRHYRCRFVLNYL
jgi:hypothetical protein